MYNPGVPITPSATEAHGITDEMVKGCPRFADDAKKLRKIFEEAILVGYNIIVFDIPVLMYEFDRAGVELNLSRKVIDVMKMETILSPRTLGAVYERYTGKKLEGAHDAQADVDGTEVVLGYQFKKIEKNGLNRDELLEKVGVPQDAADFFGKLKYDDEGDLIYNFGKHKNIKVKDEHNYANWMLNEKFPSQVKQLLREELKKSAKNAFTHPAPSKKIETFKHQAQKQINLYSKPEDLETKPDDDLPF
jgi:DNA polymerase-3 subunit epsilon